MGLGHGYCGEINTSVIDWYRSLDTRIPKTRWAWGLYHCMHDVFHVVSGYVFHGCDCVLVCYTLRAKHIHGMMYMGKVIAWLLRRLRLGTITLGVGK